MTLRVLLEDLLYDWLQVQRLSERGRFAEHNRETFDAVLQMCERLAADKFAPFNRLVDTEEPRTETGPDGALRVVLPQATHAARKAYADSGMLAAAQDYEMGGMQLPYVVEAAANSFFATASVSIGSNLLTVGNANCILACGNPGQKAVFAGKQLDGSWAGTMCLSEPQAGSSLSDISTRALPDGADFADDPLGPRYRLKGNKMWISSGEHEMTENIVHLVLAKIPDEDGKLLPGTRGISLFIVPKHKVNSAGQLTGERNDVTLAGLNHKCGWRGTTNTLLNFGEGFFKTAEAGPYGGGSGAIGHLVGNVGEGLKNMFHMMNEARIGVGTAATCLGLAGYYASLDYAKTRTQGRPITGAGKDPAQPPVRLIEHADIKRMLLAQKSYCEGALALQLYCAKLVDEQHTGEAEAANEARLLLEVLTPISKSWPSEWCLEANSLAIQIHGGYGYTRDFPVEQYWRDNRLNMIHEGTHGIQALDLLGRKVLMDNGKGLQLLSARMQQTCSAAPADWQAEAKALQAALAQVGQATQAAWQGGQAALALANAVPYMQAFGHVVLAWIWLDVVGNLPVVGARAAGRAQAARYFFRYELPKIDAWLQVVRQQDMTCADMAEEAF
jgi:alkylation response protein AidB-like acyl-CoA dehydrogenase